MRISRGVALAAISLSASIATTAWAEDAATCAALLNEITAIADRDRDALQAAEDKQKGVEPFAPSGGWSPEYVEANCRYLRLRISQLQGQVDRRQKYERLCPADSKQQVCGSACFKQLLGSARREHDGSGCPTD